MIPMICCEKLESIEKNENRTKYVNPFAPNEHFLYRLKTSEKSYGFLIFSRGREWVRWE